MISVYGFADENVVTISTSKLLYREKSHKGVAKILIKCVHLTC